MTLGFKPQFVTPILKGTKIHTIREDRGQRWEAGRTIHMATGVRTKNYYQFKTETCTRVQEITIRYTKFGIEITVDGKLLDSSEMQALAKNDGFHSVSAFLAWFNKDFTGRIIHWREKRY